MSSEHDARNLSIVQQYQDTLSPDEIEWHRQRRALKGRHPAAFRHSRPPVPRDLLAKRSAIIYEFILANLPVFTAELSGPVRQHGKQWLICQLLLLLPDHLAGMDLNAPAKPLKAAIACTRHAVLEAAEQESQIVAPPPKVYSESWAEHKAAKQAWRRCTYLQLPPDS